MIAAERDTAAGAPRGGRLDPGITLAFLAVLAIGVSACGGSLSRFSESNARAHLNMLAGTIGSRPTPTPTGARDYLIDQRLRPMSASRTPTPRAEFGVTARVSNIIAVRNGRRSEAVALVAHYDSSPHAPGATDDGLGVAVCLEAGRLLAARPNPVYSLIVAFTDGEEYGLMGAAALVTDPVFSMRTRAFLNFDSIGSTPAICSRRPPRGLVPPWRRRPTARNFAEIPGYLAAAQRPISRSAARRRGLNHPGRRQLRVSRA
jgi:hypothetical protein